MYKSFLRGVTTPTNKNWLKIYLLSLKKKKKKFKKNESINFVIWTKCFIILTFGWCVLIFFFFLNNNRCCLNDITKPEYSIFLFYILIETNYSTFNWKSKSKNSYLFFFYFLKFFLNIFIIKLGRIKKIVIIIVCVDWGPAIWFWGHFSLFLFFFCVKFLINTNWNLRSSTSSTKKLPVQIVMYKK